MNEATLPDDGTFVEPICFPGGTTEAGWLDGLPIVAGVALCAVCVWLVVRIVNRRERWAKWTLAMTVALPLANVLGFGPACGLVDRDLLPPTVLTTVFAPTLFLALEGPVPVQEVLWQWGEVMGKVDGRDAVWEAAMDHLGMPEVYRKQSTTVATPEIPSL
jgi:hypothetical protein